MEDVPKHLMAHACRLLAKYPPGTDLINTVSLIQRNLKVGYSCALNLAKTLEVQGVWSPLINGRRFLARDRWLHDPDLEEDATSPPRIEFIDSIARKKQRDVLCLVFTESELPSCDAFPYESLPIRRQIIDWLSQHCINWEPCEAFADPTNPVGYKGRIYVDVSPVLTDPLYDKLCNYLEDENGHCRFSNVRFFQLSLSEAIGNALYDEPGYYDICLSYFFADRSR